MVKVNSIILPGLNDNHIPEVARRMGELGVDILNCVPYHPARGSSFENMAEPSKAMVEQVRRESSAFVPMMRHCTRCRSDAVGLLGQAPNPELMRCLGARETIPDSGKAIRPPRAASDCDQTRRGRVAVASMEGVLVNQHLGEADHLLIFEKKDNRVDFLEARPTPEKGTGDARWEAMSRLLGDCRTLLVSGVGDRPKRILKIQGLEILEVEGVIEEAVSAVFDNRPLQHLARRVIRPCQGQGGGCG
jgi:nitrogen fixation protein NifB